MKITPVGKKVLVKATSKVETLHNGIKIKRTVSSRRDIHSGIVVSLGTEIEKDSKVIQVDDIVFFPAYAAQSIGVDGKDYLVIMLDDIDLVASNKIEGGI